MRDGTRYRVKCLKCGWSSIRNDHLQCECYDIQRMYCKAGSPGPGCPRGVVYPHRGCEGELIITDKVSAKPQTEAPSAHTGSTRSEIDLLIETEAAAENVLVEYLEGMYGSNLEITLVCGNHGIQRPLTAFVERYGTDTILKVRLRVVVERLPMSYAANQVYDWMGSTVTIRRVSKGQSWADCTVSNNGDSRAMRFDLPLPDDMTLISEVY